MSLWSTQPLTEMSTRSISWGKSGQCVRLTTYHHPGPLSRNLGTLTSWYPLGLSRPVMGLLYLFCPNSIKAHWIYKQYNEIFQKTVTVLDFYTCELLIRNDITPEQVVLKNFNLRLPAGKTVAIVGSSGNGISTVAALLERYVVS